MSVGARDRKDELTLRAVLVDDEPLAREYLKLLLSRIGGVSVEAECVNAAECVNRIADIDPDVVFLDIRLPGDSGLEIASALAGLDSPPQIVFVTGYDEYALPAFDVAAVDYVLKPLSEERLIKTLGRVRSRLAERHRSLANTAQVDLGKLAVRNKDGAALIDVVDICYVRTQGRKTLIQTVSEAHLTHFTLAELEDKLAGHRFFRANEGCLVNLDRVREIVYCGPRTYELLLSEPKETFIPLSRSRAQELRELLDF